MKRRVLIVRLDAIGDYILFRNVLHFIRKSEKYRDAELTLLGNPAWREIAETYDADCADHWIWLENRNSLFRKPIENLLPYCIWHHRVRKAQRRWSGHLKGAFDEVLSLQAFRDPLLDEFVSDLAPTVVNGWELPQGESPFVFVRNRAIASAITGETCDCDLELPRPDVPKTKKVLFFTGAAHWTRRWPKRNWRNLANLLPSGYSYWHAVKDSTLPEFFKQVAASAVVVTNDTMASHVAAALGVPCVTVTNGVSGKDGFWPYPAELKKPCSAIMPEIKRVPRIIPALLRERLAQYLSLAAITPEKVGEELRNSLTSYGKINQ